ncbi:craniofacial development protein 2-like [Plakobranchus ocellatus]|uniref:Craniofacial development protein 2-like n=1 Tax=Plakobranchus ocellatus TaxID=259542 RepID=A0AAV3ZGK0_9GAST|nr:craniofacial development protein 2-like [Plakobranchus ocellatus]
MQTKINDVSGKKSNAIALAGSNQETKQSYWKRRKFYTDSQNMLKIVLKMIGAKSYMLFDVTTKKSGELVSNFRYRAIVAKLVAKPLNLGIIQMYASTSDSEDIEVEKFYEEIEKAEGCLKSQDIIILMGDSNAKVGDERVEDVGLSGIGIVNECGSRLIGWCQIIDFTITNTWYQNHPRRQ